MVRKNTVLANEEVAGKEVPTCHHYWVIDSPEGPTSRGVCKFCGAVKEFYNSWGALGSSWTRSSTPHARRATVPAADIEPEETEPEEKVEPEEVSKEYTDEDWEDES